MGSRLARGLQRCGIGSRLSHGRIDETHRDVFQTVLTSKLYSLKCLACRGYYYIEVFLCELLFSQVMSLLIGY